MVEVLVSIMITMAFLMGTLQALLINAIFQVQSEREAQATFWIQEDMEKIKAVAEMYPFDGTEDDGSVLSLKHDYVCMFGAGNDGFTYGYGGQLRTYLADTNNGYSESGGSTDGNVQIVRVQGDENMLVRKEHRLVRIVVGDDQDASSKGEADQSPHVLRIIYKVGEPYVAAEDSDGVDDGSVDTDGDGVNDPDFLKDENGRGFKETLATVYTEVIPSGTFSCSL
ncbi:MAG: hypothetical protein AB4041_11235 [Microcystaceae cyanobacterium]